MEKEKTNIGVPGAIIIAGLLIAGAVVFAFSGGQGSLPERTSGNNDSGNAVASSDAPDDFRFPNEDDHVRGAENPTVTIVEYSDMECPFCSRVHPTIQAIVDANDDVAWVYRHFPLNSIHAEATPAAIASECVADLAGNDAFYAFADTMFANQSKLGSNFYSETAVSLGIDAGAFNACLSNPDILARVNEDLNEVIALGGRGTPFSVIITADNKLIPASGNLPQAQFQAIIDQAREN